MKKRLLATAVLALLILPGIALASPPRPGPYVSGFLGVNLPRDSSVTTFDYPTGIRVDDRPAFDPGISTGATGGYDFGHVRFEGELSYRGFSMRSVDQLTPVAEHYRNIDGDLGALAFMVNAFMDLHLKGPVTPYWGAGIGFASVRISDTYGDTTSLPITRDRLYREDDAEVFAYQAGAGVGIEINPQLTLDLGYRYFGTGNIRFEGYSDRTTEMKLESHSVNVGLRVKF